MRKTLRLENFHIFLWIVKDICWVMMWRKAGIFMIFPTVDFGALIAWQHRKSLFDLLPNLAVLFWIIANLYWMVTEFYGVEYEYKKWAGIPFSIGVALIVAHHVIEIKRMRKEGQIKFK